MYDLVASFTKRLENHDHRLKKSALRLGAPYVVSKLESKLMRVVTALRYGHLSE